MAKTVLTPFTTAQLDMLKTKAGDAFMDWALMQPSVRRDSVIKDAAAIHAWLRLELAQCSYGVFNDASRRGASMESRYRGQTFAQYAGIAAGHLAVSKLVAVWYGLNQTDIEQVVPKASDRLRVISSNCELLEPTIGRLPQALGIVGFTTYDVSSQTRQYVTEAATLHGDTATDPFFTFSRFPTWANFNPIDW